MRTGLAFRSLAADTAEVYLNLIKRGATVIQVDPEILSGTAVFAGTRVPAETLAMLNAVTNTRTPTAKVPRLRGRSVVRCQMAHRKMHMIRQVNMYDPPVTLALPRVINLLTDLKEERDVTAKNGWVTFPMLKMLAELEESLKKDPPIKIGTPEPYAPPK